MMRSKKVDECALLGVFGSFDTRQARSAEVCYCYTCSYKRANWEIKRKQSESVLAAVLNKRRVYLVVYAAALYFVLLSFQLQMVHYDANRIPQPIRPLNETDSAPWGAAICLLHDEGSPHLEEFVEYHLALGFDHIYIYGDLEQDRDIQKMANSGEKASRGTRAKITLQHWPRKALQHRDTNEHCLQKLKREKTYEWVATLQTNEYVVLKAHDHMNDLLYDPETKIPPAAGGLSLYRMAFRWSAEVATTGPLVHQMVYRNPLPERHVKTILRVTSNQIQGNGPMPTIYLSDTSGNPVLVDDHDFTVVDQRHAPPTDVAVIHHYRQYRYGYSANDDDELHFPNGCTKDTCVRDSAAWQFLSARFPHKYGKLAGEDSF